MRGDIIAKRLVCCQLMCEIALCYSTMEFHYTSSKLKLCVILARKTYRRDHLDISSDSKALKDHLYLLFRSAVKWTLNGIIFRRLIRGHYKYPLLVENRVKIYRALFSQSCILSTYRGYLVPVERKKNIREKVAKLFQPFFSLTVSQNTVSIKFPRCNNIENRYVLSNVERQWRSNFVPVLRSFSNSSLADIIVILAYCSMFGRRDASRRYYSHVLCMSASVYK